MIYYLEIRAPKHVVIPQNEKFGHFAKGQTAIILGPPVSNIFYTEFLNEIKGHCIHSPVLHPLHLWRGSSCHVPVFEWLAPLSPGSPMTTWLNAIDWMCSPYSLSTKAPTPWVCKKCNRGVFAKQVNRMICKSLHLWKHTTSWSLTADTQLTNQHFFIPTITTIVNKASTHRISHCLAVGGAARSSTKHPKIKSVVSLGKSVVSPGKSVVSKNVNFWKKHILLSWRSLYHQEMSFPTSTLKGYNFFWFLWNGIKFDEVFSQLLSENNIKQFWHFTVRWGCFFQRCCQIPQAQLVANLSEIVSKNNHKIQDPTSIS